MKRLFWERLAWLWILCIPLAVAGGIGYGGQAYNPQSVAITGGTIGGTSVAGVAAAGAASPYNPSSVAITGGTITASTINATTSQSLNGNLIMSATAPTILNGFGTGASISQANGTAAFTINVGTGGTSATGTIIMPAAPTGWVCFFVGEYPGGQINEETRHVPGASGSPTTDVPVYNELVSTGVASAWPSGTILYGSCTAH